MKVSIIIPVYNVEEYIADCLNSVIDQTYQGDLECVIVDDCTPDNSCAIIEDILSDYKGNIEFKFIHHEHNKGLSGARNTGIDYATGDYLYFLDSDDEITKDCIEVLCSPLNNSAFDIVIGNYIEIPHNSTHHLMKLEGSIIGNKDIVGGYLGNTWYVMAWNKLCRKDFLLHNHLYFKEGLIHEDDLWNFEISCVADSIYISNKYTYKYRIRQNSIMTSSDNRKHWFAYFEVIDSMLSFIERLSSNSKFILYKYILAYQNRLLYVIGAYSSYNDYVWGRTNLQQVFFKHKDLSRINLHYFFVNMLYGSHYYCKGLGKHLFRIISFILRVIKNHH